MANHASEVGIEMSRALVTSSWPSVSKSQATTPIKMPRHSESGKLDGVRCDMVLKLLSSRLAIRFVRGGPILCGSGFRSGTGRRLCRFLEPAGGGGR